MYFILSSFLVLSNKSYLQCHVGVQNISIEVCHISALDILLSNTYGTIGRELQVEATIMGLGNSDGLDLEFWADTPSGKYKELAKIKTKSLSPGEEASYTVKITPKEEGSYTIYASLYDKLNRIGRDSDTLRVRK
jgi:hypothetical protein